MGGSKTELEDGKVRAGGGIARKGKEERKTGRYERRWQQCGRWE